MKQHTNNSRTDALIGFFSGLSGTGRSVSILCVALLAHLIIYWNHYFGVKVFPWDFVGGYHALAYSWLELVKAHGAFPTWNAFGTLGYPAHLDLQNSAFYPPIYLLTFLDIDYTLHAAVVIQCLHILLGCVGLLLLCRRLGINRIAILFAIIVYQLSGGFFANSQHVDIIRGYALLPWIFYFSEIRIFNRYKKIKLAVLPLIYFCFITGVYTGIIIAAFYTILVYLALQLFFVRPDKASITKFVGFNAVAITLVLAIAAIKFLPAIGLMGELNRLEGTNRFSLTPIDFLSLSIFDYSSKGLPIDIAMRSFYVGIICTLGLFLIRVSDLESKLLKTFLLTLLISFVFTLDTKLAHLIRVYVPGMDLSRFPISDFRTNIILFFTLVGVIALSNLLHYRSQLGELTVRLAAFIFAVVCFAYYHVVNHDFDVSDVLSTVTLAVLVSSICLMYVSANFQNEVMVRKVVFPLFIVFLTILMGMTYHTKHAITWAPDGKDFIEKSYKVNLSDKEDDAPPYDAERLERPARYVNEHYKRFTLLSYYTGNDYAMMAYDMGKKLHRVMRVIGPRMFKQDGEVRDPKLFDFLSQKSRFVEIDADCVSDFSSVCEAAFTEKNSTRAVLKHFHSQSSVFEIDSEKPVILLENEMFYPGWRGIIHRATGEEGIYIKATRVGKSLRAWELPAGKYSLKTEYWPPYYGKARVLSWIGILSYLTLLAGLVGYFVHESVKRRSARPS